MEYKVFEENDIELMKDFVDDQNTVYENDNLLNFINEKNTYGFIAKKDGKIIGFAYGYVLVRPDGKKDFYMHSIDVTKEYQNKGYGTELMNYINEYIIEIGCRKMFLVTNKSNIGACKCYIKSGGINKSDDDIVYAYMK